MKCFPDSGQLRPIFGETEILTITSDELDDRLATGWRHFGTRFFRGNFAVHGGALCGIVPLRVRLALFAPTTSQRRVQRKNADTQVRIGPAAVNSEIHELFHRHKTRFTTSVPDSIHDFVSSAPATVPCRTRMVEVRHNDRLLAVSFFDVSRQAVSCVYAMFDPDAAARSLGTFTILREIEYARAIGRQLCYLGYSYTVPSHYDYKLRFGGLEAYDWDHGWEPVHKRFEWSRPFER